ncbi:MAG: TonB-dependent receptor [Paludibacteraceae bacterium]|nr:TonB-dependent receptor [Paludibacteraceae bacterium]
MKKSGAIFILLLVCASLCRAQVTGVVLDDSGSPMIGANVYWAGTGTGVATDIDGKFTLMPVKRTKDRSTMYEGANVLVVSFVGYHNDTTVVTDRKPLTIVMVEEAVLDEVTITERKQGVLKSRTSAFDTETIGTEELCRAACCNLSEAFETNASVDVAYADAATGAKQIRLLGLSGTYVQLIQENTPAVRGLAQIYGMEYIPGPWMSSIQVSKGTSSVINGYEATSGQINVELLKPQTQNPLSVNLMLNSELMAEANIMGGWKIPLNHHQSLYTGILAHYGHGFMAMDDNKDSFVDMPRTQNANLANRWFYKRGDYTFQAFVRGLYDRRRGGQLHMDGMDSTMANPYHINLNTWRVEGFLKNGYVFDEESGSSVAVIAAVSYHNLDNTYGLRNWKADQLNAYLNAICQLNFEGGGLIDNDHRLSTGLSVNYDKYGEVLNLGVSSQTPLVLDRDELTPGIFAEYSYTYADQLSLVAGVRADYSTRYGFFVTPRMNIRYTPWQWWVIRASAGMGYRSPNAIADNANILPSSRVINGLAGTGIQQERAVNTGLSTTFHIPMGSRELQLSAEYYYTHFINSVIVDLDRDPHAVYIYNQRDINGRSFAHSAQVEAGMEVLRGWTWTAAFRWTDVEQTTIDSGGAARTRIKPLTSRFKGVVTTSYQTPLKKWQFDVTAQFNGISRMPDGFTPMGDLNGGYANPKPLTWYPQLMAQVTKYWRTCSLYVGAENMTNFRQAGPIVDSFNPYGSDFDASMAWGPITGWKVYMGFRYDLEKKE